MVATNDTLAVTDPTGRRILACTDTGNDAFNAGFSPSTGKFFARSQEAEPPVGHRLCRAESERRACRPPFFNVIARRETIPPRAETITIESI
jgi:hypothetical protein